MTRRDRWAAIARRVVVAALLLATTSLASSCDPCAGIASCRTSPRVSYTGRIVDFETGRGVPGVAVVFRPAAGSALAADSLVAVTDAEGRFVLAGDARAAGTITGAVTVRPPAPRPQFSVGMVEMTTTETRGAGGVLDAWTVQPYIAWVGSVVTRRGASAAWAAAQFHRTGGARLADDRTLVVGLDPNGYFYLQALALDTGAVIGDLDIYGAGLTRVYRVEHVVIPVRVLDRVPKLDRVLHVGSSLEYALELHYRGSWAPVAGAEVVFRRRRGLRLERDSVTATTNADGRVRLAPVPATDSTGEVVGDVTVRAPGLRRPYVIPDVRLQTFDSDELRFAGTFGVGYAAQAAGELAFRGDRSPLAGVDVRFVRTGGLETSVATVTTQSRPDGWFGVALATDTVGEVVGDLVIQRPGGAPPTTFRGLRLRAAGDDSVRYAGRFAVGAQLSYAGVLVQRATGLPAAGWTVTFRRTGGIRLVTDTLRSTVLDWGGFGLSPATREEGTVEGTLTARSPSGDREASLGAVRLGTFEGDEVRLAGRWAVGPSLLYVGELRRDDTGEPIVGARAEFRRTGGIPTAEPVVGETSNASGRFRMAPTPLASGEVVGDLYVFPQPPLRDTVFRDVRLQTFETDETRLHAVWRLAGPR